MYPQAPAQTRTVTYKGEAEYKHGIAHMQRHGWRIQATASNQPRSGCMRVLMLGGIGALIWKPKAHFVVTFAR